LFHSSKWEDGADGLFDNASSVVSEVEVEEVEEVEEEVGAEVGVEKEDEVDVFNG
jgi:hypothetical protein